MGKIYQQIYDNSIVQFQTLSWLACLNPSSTSSMAQDGDDMVPLDTELLAQLEEEAATRYTQEDTHFIEVRVCDV